MTNAIDIVNNVVKIGKTLRDVAALAKDAHTKNLIADLNLVLADLKMTVAALQEENLELKNQINVLQSKDDIRSKLSLNKGAYWFKSDPPAGRERGPYCTGCFDSSEKLIVLGDTPRDFRNMVGKYACPVCKQHFGN